MNLTTVGGNVYSFSNTIMTQKDNAADIQKASISDDFNNKDLLYYEETTQKLKLYENILLTKYYNKIKASCEAKQLTPELNHKYKYRPEALSTDEYGFPGLWYLILYVNGCEDCSEFHDLSHVLIPKLDTIQQCLMNEEFINNKDDR